MLGSGKNFDDGDSLWGATDMEVKDYLSTGILVNWKNGFLGPTLTNTKCFLFARIIPCNNTEQLESSFAKEDLDILVVKLKASVFLWQRTSLGCNGKGITSRSGWCSFPSALH